MPSSVIYAPCVCVSLYLQSSKPCKVIKDARGNKKIFQTWNLFCGQVLFLYQHLSPFPTPTWTTVELWSVRDPPPAASTVATCACRIVDGPQSESNISTLFVLLRFGILVQVQHTLCPSVCACACEPSCGQKRESRSLAIDKRRLEDRQSRGQHLAAWTWQRLCECQ